MLKYLLNNKLFFLIIFLLILFTFVFGYTSLSLNTVQVDTDPITIPNTQASTKINALNVNYHLKNQKIFFEIVNNPFDYKDIDLYLENNKIASFKTNQAQYQLNLFDYNFKLENKMKMVLNYQNTNRDLEFDFKLPRIINYQTEYFIKDQQLYLVLKYYSISNLLFHSPKIIISGSDALKLSNGHFDITSEMVSDYFVLNTVNYQLKIDDTAERININAKWEFENLNINQPIAINVK